MLSPIRRGSSVKTLVVKPVSSELRKASVIGVSSRMFLAYSSNFSPSSGR